MKKIIVAAAVLALLGIAFFIGFTGYAVKEDAKPKGDSGIREFEVKAFRFGYSPDTITVNKGDKVRIKIDNTDTMHGIRIPSLGISGNDVVELSADAEGEFEWLCNVMCGSGHREMKGKLIVKGA